MEAPRGKLHHVRHDIIQYWCPACQCIHQIHIITDNGKSGVRWEFNGDYEKPTFSPSVKTWWNKPIAQGEELQRQRQLAKQDASYVIPRKEHICHHFVRGGMLEFCPDCTHALAGQTVPLPEWPERDE